NGTVKLWETATAKEVASFPSHVILGAPANGKLFALQTPGGGVAKLFDSETGKEKLVLRHENSGVGCLAFSPDSQTVATGNNSSPDSLKFWDVASGAERSPPRGSAGWVIGLAFAGDSKTVVTLNTDGVIKLWDAGTASDRLPIQPAGYSGVTFS